MVEYVHCYSVLASHRVGLPPATRLASRENSYFLRKYQISSSQSRQKAFLVVSFKASWGKTMANHEKREGGRRKEDGGKRAMKGGRRTEDEGRRKKRGRRKMEGGRGRKEGDAGKREVGRRVGNEDMGRGKRGKGKE